ncbi:MAG: phosphatase PAP2 family protein [Acidimicrobiales bacterium]
MGNRRQVVSAAAVLVAAAAAIFAVGIGLGLGLVGRHGGGLIQGWDGQVQTWDLHHRFGLVGASKVVAFLGDAPKLAVIAVGLTIILLIAIRTIRSLVPIVAYLGGELQVYLIRAIIHRHRPPTANFPAPGAVPGVHETSFSFPSGHSVAVTAVLFACLGVLALAYRWWWPWALAFLASLYVIYTRLNLGVHWFSDVTFGLVLGIAWGVTVAFVAYRVDWDDVRAWLPGRRRRPAPTREPAPDR